MTSTLPFSALTVVKINGRTKRVNGTPVGGDEPALLKAGDELELSDGMLIEIDSDGWYDVSTGHVQVIPPMPQDQWDENLRGPRMSGTTGNRIWKYQMPMLEEFTMELPIGAEILRVAFENGFFWMWAQVNTAASDTTRKFHAFKAGGTMPDDLYNFHFIGMAPLYIQQELMLYFYEDMEYAL